MARQSQLSFAERLRHLQFTARLTNDALAAKSGVSLRLIQKYRSGPTEPRNIFGDPSVNAHKLADALGVAVAELVPTDGEPDLQPAA